MRKSDLLKLLPALSTRSKGRCEARTDACGASELHVHHRKMRSQGGPDSLDNLIMACRDCHLYIHAHPADSYRNGWLVRSWDNQ